MTYKGRQAAARLGISLRMLYYLIASGILPKPPRKKLNSRPDWTKKWMKKAEAIVK